MSVNVKQAFKIAPLALGVSAALLLVGCGGSDSSPSYGPEIKKMTPVQVGFQTLQTRAHSVNISAEEAPQAWLTNPIDEGSSKYVYRNADTGASHSVVFEGEEDSETGDPVPMPEPVIADVVDLNEQYFAINIINTTVELEGQKHFGDFTLIQDKQTGVMYPLTENGTPIYNAVDAEHEAWMTKTRFSNVGDEAGIYLRYGKNKSLYRAVLKEGAFALEQIFADYHRENWIMPNGDVVTVPWHESGSPATLRWQDKASGETYELEFNYQLYGGPFLYDGMLMLSEMNSDKVKQIKLEAGELSIIDTQWRHDGYLPTWMSVRRGEFEMMTSCEVYQFDVAEKMIRSVYQLDGAYEGLASAAGQNSLFCTYFTPNPSDDADFTSVPGFVRFDILSSETAHVEQGVGTALDAGERLAVVSDQEVMFYQYPAGEFKEYYVNFASDQVETLSTRQESLVKMVTVK